MGRVAKAVLVVTATVTRHDLITYDDATVALGVTIDVEFPDGFATVTGDQVADGLEIVVPSRPPSQLRRSNSSIS